MGQIVGKIVLTGGPCAGKTTALAKIEEYYQEKGYMVLVINESATEIIKGGIKPFGNCPLSILKFQEIILKYQLFKEKLYSDIAKQYDDNKKIMIIHDRGLLDNKAYIGQKNFSNLLKKMNLKEIDIMDNYDMVIHLVTAADGAPDAYTLSNNTARTETIEQAKELDKKTMNAWAGHQNLKIINNDSTFDNKMNKVIETINTFIDAPVTIRKQKKYLVDLNKTDLSFLNEDNSTIINIKQYYLDTNELETRLRVRNYDGAETYYITVQRKLTDGKSNVITNRNISKKEFEDILLNANDYKIVKKKRISFTIDKQYYVLDIFEDNGLALLEIEPTKDNKEINIPFNFNIVKEVTSEEQFYNSKLATKNKVLIKKY